MHHTSCTNESNYPPYGLLNVSVYKWVLCGCVHFISINTKHTRYGLMHIESNDDI